MSRLVLTRKIDEEIYLHKDFDIFCKICVTKIDKNSVRLSFEALDATKIDRSEIYEAKLAQENLNSENNIS